MGELVHGGPDLADSASSTMNPARRSPSVLEKMTPVPFHLLLISFRLGAPIDLKILWPQPLMTLMAAMRKKMKEERGGPKERCSGLAADGAPASGGASRGRRCGGRKLARSKPAWGDRSFPQIGCPVIGKV
jgi:hypothetical protein